MKSKNYHRCGADRAPARVDTTIGMDAAIARFRRELPGWWWTIGSHESNSGAYCGVEERGPDAHLLEHWLLADGFGCVLSHPASEAESLLTVLEKAKATRAAVLN